MSLRLPIDDIDDGAPQEVARRRTVDRFLGHEADAFIAPGELVRDLLATADPDRCSPRSWEMTLRQAADLERVDHVAYHRSAPETLLGRLTRHHEAGSHWFGRFHSRRPSWEDLIQATIHDLKWAQVYWKGCDDLIAATGDPLTCDWEVQVSMAGWLLRLERGTNPTCPRICGRRFASDRSVGEGAQVLPRTVVWMLPDEPEAAVRVGVTG